MTGNAMVYLIATLLSSISKAMVGFTPWRKRTYSSITILTECCNDRKGNGLSHSHTAELDFKKPCFAFTP